MCKKVKLIKIFRYPVLSSNKLIKLVGKKKKKNYKNLILNNSYIPIGY